MSIGDVTFIEAARQRAITFASCHRTLGKLTVQVHCDSEEIPDGVFEVDVKLEAMVLNPRQGAE